MKMNPWFMNMMNVPNVPLKKRNPYTIWFKYANQNLNNYNRIAIKYNMERLQFPLHIHHKN
jgi:hypothetical protein